MVFVPTLHAIYLYGGLAVEEEEDSRQTEYASNQLWKFNLDSKRWTEVQVRRFLLLG